jgi:transposase InsO family protein
LDRCGSGNASGKLGESTVPAKRLRAERPNHVWALDFQFDTTGDGRTLKLLHVVDEYTREALAMRVARSSAERAAGRTASSAGRAAPSVID